MENIKNLAVRHQNRVVHAQEFLGLVQQPDEGIRHFLARLRGVASRCNFEVECMCTKSVSYGDAVIQFKLIAGLNCGDIKEDILSAEDTTLEETVKTIENKESGKSAKKTVEAAGQVSKIYAEKVGGGGQSSRQPCTHCGRRTHGSSPTEREKDCLAYSRTCNTCGRSGHLEMSVNQTNRQNPLNKRSHHPHFC